ncbi:MAG: helix-turn-helix domain-containing protein [Terriglobales bacterium]
MGDPALDKSNDPLAIEGFEMLLENTPPISHPTEEETPQARKLAAPPKVEPTQTGWTLKEAAKNLGVSVNTVRKRLIAGELEGIKIESPYGFEWRVYPPSKQSAVPPPVLEDTPQSQQSSPSPSVEDSLTRLVMSEHSDSAIERLVGLLESHTEMIRDLHVQLARKDELIAEKETEIKLLTDSQHEPSRWRRFWSWFVGR